MKKPPSPETLELACLAQWPAKHRTDQSGWEQTATMGQSGRANAVWAISWRGEYSLEQQFLFCALWAERHGVPLVFKLADGATTPEDLPDFLTKHAFAPRPETETIVMRRQIEALAAPEREIAWAAKASDEYLAVLRAASPSPEDYAERRDILSRAKADAIFPIAHVDGAAAAIGLGRRSGSLVGIYLMRTAPAMRRQGLARDIVRAISAWGRFHGGAWAFLQVEADNSAATSLYRSEGFEESYRYRYWTRD